MDSTVILPSSPIMYRNPEYLLSNTPTAHPSQLAAMHSAINQHFTSMSYPDPMIASPNSDCSDASPQQVYPLPDIDYDFVGNDSGFDLLAAQTWDDRKAIPPEYVDLEHVKHHLFTLDGHYLNSNNTQFNIPLSNAGHNQQLESFSISNELELTGGTDYVTVPSAPQLVTDVPTSSSEGSDSPVYRTPPSAYIDIPTPPYLEPHHPLSLTTAPPVSPISPLSLHCGSPQTPVDGNCHLDPGIVSASPSQITGSPISIGPIGFEAGVKACPMPVVVQAPSEDYDSSYDDSGEDEKPDEDDDDYDYIPSRSTQRRAQAHSRRNRSNTANNRVMAELSAHSTTGIITRTIRTPRVTRIAVPVPVPNLTKKSRGRRVPTSPSVVVTNGIQKHSRSYMCQVEGCGKCFQRGEHLKRHIRSIHTNEKPHKCPHPNCGKEFSRHDNLCQHLRVHRNFSAPCDGY